MRFTCPFTATSILKTEFFIPISSDEKGATSGFRVLANHLASFFFLTLFRRFIRATILNSMSPSLSTRLVLWSADSLTYILTEFVTSAARNWPFIHLSFRPVNSNTEGYWEIDLTSLLSVADHVTIYIYIYIYIYSENTIKYLDLARGLKTLWKIKVMLMPIIFGRHGKETGRTGDLWKIQKSSTPQSFWDQLEYWDLKRLTVTYTSVKNQQLKLIWKNSQGVKKL